MRALIKQLAFVAILCSTITAKAQTKVFKEVSSEISSTMKLILQDNSLVGYLMFTRLEAVSDDSFNYRITIMDENLNDIGTVNFKDESLFLQAVSFEQDILCLAYVKSNFIGSEFKNKKAYKEARDRAKHAVVTQFLNLDGKIIGSNSITADILPADNYYSREFIGGGRLKQPIQLNNIPGKGFALFYGDEKKNMLAAYDITAKELWNKKPANDAKNYIVLTSREDIFILTKKENEKREGGYEVIGFSAKDGGSYDKYVLKDKKGHQLKVLNFANDPVTGKPYIAGSIISERRNGVSSVRDITRGAYAGVFAIDITGPKKSDYKETFSYWYDESNAGFSEYGKTRENGSYSLLQTGFRDYNGNTFFAGSSVLKRTKWGSIASTIIFSPFVIPSIWIAAGGYTKYKETDATLLKLTSKGNLSLENYIPANSGKFRSSMNRNHSLPKSFYEVSNTNTKTNYVVVDDVKDIVVYNISKKKIARTIPHKDGNSRINVFPAKEGYIMVSEYNRKEKYTKLSIEAL